MRRPVRLRVVALATALVAAAGGCSDATAPVIPLANAQPLAVSFTTNTGVSVEGTPSATVEGARGGVHVTLRVSGTCAMDAQVRASYAGSRVEVWVTRVANALADCAPGAVGYEYDVTATGLAAGSYDVRVVDQLGDQPAQVVKHQGVAVAAN